MTEVSISGSEFLVDGRPTHEGRIFEGHRVKGLFFNVRAVQATFDDANPDTRHYWDYPDTGEWDPERNVAELCAALPAWRDHGVLSFTINFQGGGPLYTPEIYHHYDNNGFTPNGELKSAYADRIERVLASANELGMIVMVGLFYWVFLLRMNGAQAVWRAADEALSFLEETGHRNVVIEIANEIDVVAERTEYGMFRPARAHQMIENLRSRHPRFLYSASGGGVNLRTGRGMPPAPLYEAVDFVLLHGNGNRAAELEAAIKAMQALPEYHADPKPIVINEDSTGMPNLEVAWRHGVSWGYFDQGFGGAAAWAGDAYVDCRSRPRESRYEDLSGFQTPPVNWSINTELKRAFFERVAEITGSASSRL